MDHFGTEQVPHPGGEDPPLQALRPHRRRAGRARGRAGGGPERASTGCSATSCAPAASTSSSCCTAPTARAKSHASSTRSSAAWSTTRASPRARSTGSTGSSPPRSWSRAPSASATRVGAGGRARPPSRTSTPRTSTCGCRARCATTRSSSMPRDERQKLLEQALKEPGAHGRRGLRPLRLHARRRALPQVPAHLHGAARRLRRRLPQGAAPRAGASASTSRAATRSAR